VKRLEFWFEFASTYSYPAAMRLEKAAAAAGVEVAWKPFLLGPRFQRQGWNDSPFNLYPARGRYMWRDLERLCAEYGLPFRRPTRFPRHSVLAARVALVGEGEAWMPSFARAVYEANFAHDREISDPAVLGEILRSLGQDADATLARATSPGNKENLRRRTEAAWEAGICGAPSFLVDGELFWGQDRMDQALRWARGETHAASFPVLKGRP
jgi:2-hydroxychromene-2-carboxylate isomerase